MHPSVRDKRIFVIGKQPFSYLIVLVWKDGMNWKHKSMFAASTRDCVVFCRWADQRTRALFIDFVFFNAYTNLFTIVKYVYEVAACGSLIEFHDIDSIRLYTYVGEHGLVLLIMQLLWLLIFIISTVREVIFMMRNRKLYFKESWNWIKLTNIVVVCGTMVAFALKSVYIQLTVEEVKNNIGK